MYICIYINRAKLSDKTGRVYIYIYSRQGVFMIFSGMLETYASASQQTNFLTAVDALLMERC